MAREQRRINYPMTITILNPMAICAGVDDGIVRKGKKKQKKNCIGVS